MIIGEKVCLRPITIADTDNILRWRNSAAVRSYFINREPLTREIHEQWLTTRVRTGRVVQFIISGRSNGMDVGTVYLRDIDRDNRNAEFGIYIGELCARHKGYGTEAARLICEYAFRTLGLHRVYLRVLADNAIARHCYENVGFREEGVFRDHAFDGKQYHHIAFMGYVDCAADDGEQHEGE